MTTKLAICASVLVLAGCSGESQRDTGKVAVAATIFPLADLARQVGGEHVAVTCIVPPGISPHGFELNPRGRGALAEAKLILSAGPVDTWLRPAMVARARHVVLADVAGPPPVNDADHDDDHAGHTGHDDNAHVHAGPDPHYWLDPRNMAALAERVGEALAELDPSHGEDYRRRAADYARQCRELVAEMAAAGADLPHKVFVAEHPAYARVAALMGLRQVASIEPVVGAAGAPGHIQELIDQVIAQRVPAIFTEPQLSGRDAQAVARAAAARGRPVKLLTLDPIGGESVPGRQTYLDNMRANMAALREGLE
jgi:zinc transport system substrate-binding protein